MDEIDNADRNEAERTQDARYACPQCASMGHVVTAVTVKTLGTRPRTVLVTYRCTAPTCMFKYPILKTETDLTDEERAAWR